MAIPNEEAKVHEIAREGYFSKVAAGDKRASGLFARFVAYRLNPTGNSQSWGWLSKSPGETQVEGYSEDSIVYGSNQEDLNNVVDIVVGAGKAGASIGWQRQPRRSSNRWVQPRPLTAEEMAYLGGTTIPPEEPPPNVPPPTVPPNVPGCQYEPPDVSRLQEELKAIKEALAMQNEVLAHITAKVENGELLLQDLGTRFARGFEGEARGGWPLGTVKFTLRG